MDLSDFKLKVSSEIRIVEDSFWLDLKSFSVLECDLITVRVDDQFLSDVLEQNLRYSLTERYEFV